MTTRTATIGAKSMEPANSGSFRRRRREDRFGHRVEAADDRVVRIGADPRQHGAKDERPQGATTGT